MSALSDRLRDYYERWSFGAKGPHFLIETADELEANEALIKELVDLVRLVHGSFGGGRVITFSDEDIEAFSAVLTKVEADNLLAAPARQPDPSREEARRIAQEDERALRAELESIRGYHRGLLEDLAALEETWPRSKRGSKAQKHLDSIIGRVNALGLSSADAENAADRQAQRARSDGGGA